MMELVIRNLRKEFFSIRGKTVALAGIDLEVDPGLFYVLLGPSGCGKTTLLNIIAGIEKPSAGEIRIGDRLVVSVEKKVFASPKDRNVAMVFQSYALYPHMTVFDNIAFPLRIAKMGAPEIRRKVEAVAETLEITQLLRSKPAELSGGQRQRVAIGRAIVRRPNLLLMDEPLSNLDAQLRVAMRRELKKLQRELKLTTVYVTHDQTEAMALGDRIALMKDGALEQVGAPDHVYNDPESVFAASFVGTPPMNILDAERLQAAGVRLAPPAGVSPAELLVGVRPERVTVKAGDSCDAITAHVTMVGSMGIEKLLYLDLHGQEVIATSSPDQSLAEGDTVSVTFDPSDLRYFRKSDGRRLRAHA